MDATKYLASPTPAPSSPQLPPTPDSDSPLNTTILPQVKAHLSTLPLTPPSPAGELLSPNTSTSIAASNGSTATTTTTTISQPPPPSAPLLAGLNVLHQTSLALAHLHHTYASSPAAQAAFQRTVDITADALVGKGNNGKKTTVETNAKGKLVVCAVGKSAKVAQKFVATCTSLRLRCVFLHAAEALHGDLGVLEWDDSGDGDDNDIYEKDSCEEEAVGRDTGEGGGGRRRELPTDVLLLITYSARTPELRAVMRHVPRHVPVVVLTAWEPRFEGELCPLLEGRGTEPGKGQEVILPAGIPVNEEEAFGVRAPTTSTTVALALCDALALAIAGEVHGGGLEVEKVFKRCHPGGAIGEASRGDGK